MGRLGDVVLGSPVSSQFTKHFVIAVKYSQIFFDFFFVCLPIFSRTSFFTAWFNPLKEIPLVSFNNKTCDVFVGCSAFVIILTDKSY